MRLTVRQAASYLQVDESTVRGWIRKRGLPAHSANERLYLNAVELWQWATENGITVSRGLLDDARRVPEEVPPLSTLLRAGGIHDDTGGEDKAGVLREIVTRLPLPPDLDREFLIAVLEAREAMGSTGIGDGIAIPHARNPIVLHVAQPLVALCRLRHPVDFDAADGVPVHALFVVISPSVPAHLKILSRLGLVLRDATLRQLLGAGAPADAVITRIEELENRSTAFFRAPR